MIILTYLILLISLADLHFVFGNEDVKPDAIPQIWPAIRQDKSYRLMFQLQVFGTSERLTVEEWASFDKQMFRLDLITSELRTTYLTNGKTGEIFRYKPFVCDQLAADSKELALFGNLKQSSKNLTYGLGSLWLHAAQEATKVTPLSDSTVQFRRHKFLGRYAGYELSFADPEIPYNLRLYFPKEKNKFVDVVEWIDPAKSDKASKSNPDINVEARAKLMHLDLSPVDDSVFELPVGYGCQRHAQYDRPFDLDIGLGLLHEGNPNQAVLEITTSRPRDELLNSWVSQRFTVYLMRGSLRFGPQPTQERAYYVSVTQGIDPQTSRLRRTRRVWSSANITTTDGLVYNIDETSGDCKVTRMSFKEIVKLPFPGTKDSLPQVTPEELGVDLMMSLFNDNSGYHLLREKSSNSAGSSGAANMPSTNIFREKFFEKRLDRFELKNSEGQIIWLGPVSIVKRVKSLAIFIQNIQSNPLVSQYQTTVSLFFYSADEDRILYKAVLDLISQDELDIRIMQQEMDVGACFKAEQKEDIMIKYPMESQELSRKLSSIDDLVQERFLLNLFGTTIVQPIQVSGLEMSFDNFFMYIRMTLIDLPLTHTFELKRGLQVKKPAEGSGAYSCSVREKYASSVEKCATSCEFYTCYGFSYDYGQHKCLLQLNDGAVKWEYNFASDLYQCVKTPRTVGIAKYDTSDGCSHLKPRTIVEIFEEIISSETPVASSADAAAGSQKGANAKAYVNVPLRIRIDTELLSGADDSGSDDYIELRPISVHSDMDSMNEFVREELGNHTSSSQTLNSSVVTLHQAANLRVQYNILFEGRQFQHEHKESFTPVASYDDCSLICETNDCRSFSYCETEQLCIITNTHKTADIRKDSYKEALCSIHILDYLSKFEDFGRTQQPHVVKSVLSGTSKEDCALACVENDGFNCQGFYYCKRNDLPVGDETISCLLQDVHIEESATGNRLPPQFQSPYKQALTPKSKQTCSYFSRSYLAQFDSYVGKAFNYDDVSDADFTYRIVVGAGAEDCALECVQKTCLAFHVCTDYIDHKPVCALATKQIRKTNIVSRKGCTTFVLSDKSQFNLSKTRLIAANPDRKALDKNDNDAPPDVVIDAEQQEATNKDIYANLFEWFWSLEQVKQVKDGSHFMSNLVSLLLGSVVGVVCAIIWLQKDSVYNMATRINNHYRARN